ncbi:MAG: amidohydrolase family protein [Cutibacterium avidum]|nr:amidohydrolase family protein [Cutibacterium avidum]
MTTTVALTGASVLTCDRDGTVLADHTVLVGEDGSIEAVGPGQELADRAAAAQRRIDCAGKWVMPGLINAHAHLVADGRPLPKALTNPALARGIVGFWRTPLGSPMLRERARGFADVELNSGVTTLRGLGEYDNEAVVLGRESESGQWLGPRIMASGPLLAITGGHGAELGVARIVDAPWEGRKAVRQNLRLGATSIKIAATGGVTDAKAVGEAGRPQMTTEEMTAICEEAHSAGVLVAAHAQSPEGVLRSLKAGVDTIEHGSAMTDEIVELFHDNPRSLRGWSAFDATLLAAAPLVEIDTEITGASEVVKENARIVLDSMVQGIRDAITNDVVLGSGLDSSMTFAPHYAMWRELDLVVSRAGLSPARALEAVTRVNAKMLDLESVTGAVEPGLSADLLVLGANPLDDLKALEGVETVVVRGDVIDTPTVERFGEIDELLDTLRR